MMESCSRRLKRRTWEDAPEEIIQRIQSFLLYQEAIHTSLVSKSWLQAFSTIPVLRFNRFDQPSSGRCTNSQSESVNTKYVNLAEKTLARYDQDNIAIDKFELHVSEVTNINNCIRMISTKKGLKEFHLCISGPYLSSYSFPSEIFLCRTLETFTLIGSPTNVSIYPNRSEIKCHSLRLLKLSGVTLSDQIVNVLLSVFPIIENLIIESCRGFKRIEVKKLDHLKNCKFSNNRWFVHVVLDAVPCLRSFSFGGEGSFHFRTAQNLKHVDLHMVAIDDEKVQTFLSECNLLQKLMISFCRLSKRMEISSASLKELTLVYCHGLANLTISAPNLILLSHDGLCFPTLSLMNDFPTYFKMISKLKLDCSSGSLSFSGMREVVLRSRESYLLIYRLKDKDGQQLRAISLSTSQKMEILLLLTVHWSISEYSSILDTLFSIFRPKYLAVFADLDPAFYKFLSAQLGEQIHPDCCTSPGLSKCWRHYLRDIEFAMGMKPIEDLWKFEVGRRGGQPSCYYKLTWGDFAS